MEREEIVKITEEGGRRESGDGGEGGASWGLMVMSSAGLGGCLSAVRNRAISSKQRFLYPVRAVAVEYWDRVARLIPIFPFVYKTHGHLCVSSQKQGFGVRSFWSASQLCCHCVTSHAVSPLSRCLHVLHIRIVNLSYKCQAWKK